MRAALLIEPGKMEVADIPAPQVGPDEVRIAVGGVGICGSDLSVFTGRWAVPAYPWVMGHEAFGTIEAVGPGISSERMGQTVVVEPNAACFTCAPCRRGWTSACVARQSVGMNRVGALAERLVVPSRFAWKIAGDPADLVCVEPTTVVTAALRRLGTGLPDEALVVGVGAQGQLMSLVLVERGVRVEVMDPNADRVASAVGLGAEPAATDNAGARFDLVVDTVGSPASIEAALERADIGATLLLLGLDSRPMGLTAQMVVRKQLVMRGSLTYDHPGDFEVSIAAVNAGLAPGRIVTDAYPLEDAQLAFDRSASTAGKTWIRVDQPS